MCDIPSSVAIIRAFECACWFSRGPACVLILVLLAAILTCSIAIALIITSVYVVESVFAMHAHLPDLSTRGHKRGISLYIVIMRSISFGYRLNLWNQNGQVSRNCRLYSFAENVARLVQDDTTTHLRSRCREHRVVCQCWWEHTTFHSIT